MADQKAACNYFIETRPTADPVWQRLEQISVDDIDSFVRVRKMKVSGYLSAKVSETAFKKGILKILSQQSVAKDWGGEKNDIHTTYSKLGGKRRAAAFALKGPGTKGKLIPKKMGKNGDQIQRLFHQHWRIYLLSSTGTRSIRASST